jgi:cytoskeletal protein CcmA (bactofilin family)
MSTLKVNNLEPTSGTTVIINADTRIISATGKEIDLGGATNDFSGSLNVTGSITNKDGNLVINNGNVTLKSGSFDCTGSFTNSGSADFEGETTVTGSFETSGSFNCIGTSSFTGSFEGTGSTTFEGPTTVTGSFEVQGDTDFQGDMVVSGCLDISCYTDADDPTFWGIEGRTTPAPAGLEYISINYSTYGNLTASINAAATASNFIMYIQSASVITQYALAGVSVDETTPGTEVTYISASGPEIPTGTIVQFGFPQPLAGVTSSVAYGTGVLTPIASFCCDGITLYEDTVISGSLDVLGEANFHDGLIVSGCIEMYCPGDTETAWYGYKGSTRFSKASGSGYYNWMVLDTSYGNIASYLSASAAANMGKLQLYNTQTNTTQQVDFVRSLFATTVTTLEYITPTLTAFNPFPTVHIGNQTPDLFPSGANVLMGTGSQTPVQTAQFCCDGNILFGSTTVSGSLTVTGSGGTDDSVTINVPVETSSSVTITGPLIVTGSSFDGKGGGKVTGSFAVSGSVSVTGSVTATSVTANGLFINTVLEAEPGYAGTKGETVYVVSGSNYYLYAYLNNNWVSVQLT